MPPFEDPKDENGKRRCIAHNREGERCKHAPMLGQRVCRNHGGATPVAIAAAKRRLLEAVDPAISGLLRALNMPGTCKACGRSDDMHVVVKAAQIILDRSGLGPKQTVEVQEGIPDDLREATDEELAARAEELALQTRELRALPSSSSEPTSLGDDPNVIDAECVLVKDSDPEPKEDARPVQAFSVDMRPRLVPRPAPTSENEDRP